MRVHHHNNICISRWNSDLLTWQMQSLNKYHWCNRNGVENKCFIWNLRSQQYPVPTDEECVNLRNRKLYLNRIFRLTPKNLHKNSNWSIRKEIFQSFHKVQIKCTSHEFYKPHFKSCFENCWKPISPIYRIIRLKINMQTESFGKRKRKKRNECVRQRGR